MCLFRRLFKKDKKENTMPEIRPWKFTVEELLQKSGETLDSIPESHKKNLEKLVCVVNKLGEMLPNNLKGPRLCNSGYRSSAKQMKIYKERAAKKQEPFTDGVFIESKVPITAHCAGEAIDINDPDESLDNWLMDTPEGQKTVKELDLYVENKKHTPHWCHVQIRKTKSGNRYFIPY